MPEKTNDTERKTARAVRVTKADKPCFCGSGLPYAACHGSVMEKLKELRTKGEQIPPRKLIKNREQIAGIREAGRINSLVLDAVAERIRPGMTTAQIDDIVMERTHQLGGIPTCLGFEGFPRSVCTSVNDQICHGIPSEKVILREGDIVNVDCTTTYNGYVGDASRMFAIGRVAPNAERLIRVTREAVDLAISHLYPYCHLGDIGYYIGKYAHENGYTVVREIGGHGCGLEMHEDPYVCHVGRLGTGMVLCPGMVFTIEPMINEGTRGFRVDERDGWQVYTADGKLSAQVEHMVLITEDGVEVLSE